ncbi:MAG TPA: AAA family ATPase [Candidatus Angelobacter sp.]|nr:AAA family ATPase [Candidatus Angelobacter sp.]
MAAQANMSHAGDKPKIAVITVGLDPLAYRTLAHLIAAVPAAAMTASIDTYSGAEWEVGRSGEQAPMRVCFIDYDQDPEQAIRLTERLQADHPGVNVFGISSYSDPERIIVAMRAGCAEYLLKPLQMDRLQEGLARVEARQKEKTRSRIRGRVITLIGAKGGTGVTSLALHLALELAGQAQRKCLLVDQHEALGDASLYLGTGRHRYSFYELANNTDRLDQELLQGFLLQHRSGLHVLDSPESTDSVHSAPVAAIERTLAFLAETYPYVVIDCPPGLTTAGMACLAQSDQVGIVMTAELPCVRNVVRYLEQLDRAGYAGNVQIILNRASKRGPLSDERIEKALNRKISLRIPNSYNEVIRAINAGEPISSGKSDFGAAVQKWAKETIAAAQSKNAPRLVAPSPRPGGWSLFGKTAGAN